MDRGGQGRGLVIFLIDLRWVRFSDSRSWVIDLMRDMSRFGMLMNEFIGLRLVLECMGDASDVRELSLVLAW